jgi:diguanylate cyclase (GGDEF)-like protein
MLAKADHGHPVSGPAGAPSARPLSKDPYGAPHRHFPMQTKSLNLEDFPDSAYAHELRRGITRLRFDALLEAEYTTAHLQRVRPRVRIWFSVTVVLSVLFTIEQVQRTGFGNVVSLAHLGCLIPCTTALAWLAWSRDYERLFLPAARVLVPIFSGLIAAFIAIALIIGRGEQLASLTVNLVAIFFFTGLMFRQALFAAAVMLIAFAATAIAINLEFAMVLKSMAIMLLTSGITAFVYLDVEQSYRRNFLEDALIGELVARDSLSGLMNRRAFDEHLLRVWQHALRDERVIALLMIDIDHFKPYNDAFGHQAGDLALRSVARVLQGFGRRPLDLVARYGGEEFAVILYDLALPHIHDIAERLREAVQNLKIKQDAEFSIAQEITVSVGVGLAVPTIGRTPQGAIQLADEALYEAKQSGRNRVVVKGTAAYKVLETGAFQAHRKNRRRR